MTTEYTIYLVNQTDKGQLFWSFLAQPEILNAREVFLNSGSNVYIDGFSPNINTFTIPVQYIVGAGGHSQPVKLDIKIESSAIRESDLNQGWDVTYAEVPPPKGPNISQNDSKPPSTDSIKLDTNIFNQETNKQRNWHESMSFGIQTNLGFMGVTWEPESNQSYIITPKLSFYITVGDQILKNNHLAEINSVSKTSEQVNVSDDFDVDGICTVIYTKLRTWSKHKGKPTKEDYSVVQKLRQEFLA